MWKKVVGPGQDTDGVRSFNDSRGSGLRKRVALEQLTRR